MASHRGASAIQAIQAIQAHEGQEISSLGTTSGSDAGRLSEKKEDFDEKNGEVVFESSMAEDHLPPYRDHSDVEETEAIHHPADKDDILTHTIHVEDDPTLNAITFRTIFLGKFCTRGFRACIGTSSELCLATSIVLNLMLTHMTGIGLSLFGGTISGIYYFKPQTVSVSTVFLAVITYMLGELMAFIIPRKGIIGRWLNPHPFNVKEHLAIVIMANSASISAQGIEVLAVEQLYYGNKLGGALSVFLLFSSQFLGYGIAGLMRKVLVYPKNMLWPSNLPVNSMLETLHRPRELTRKPLKVFLIVFACIFVWEIIPEWIMPLLTGEWTMYTYTAELTVARQVLASSVSPTRTAPSSPTSSEELPVMRDWASFLGASIGSTSLEVSPPCTIPWTASSAKVLEYVVALSSFRLPITAIFGMRRSSPSSPRVYSQAIQMPQILLSGTKLQ
jgi:hypothetical protein